MVKLIAIKVLPWNDPFNDRILNAPVNFFIMCKTASFASDPLLVKKHFVRWEGQIEINFSANSAIGRVGYKVLVCMSFSTWRFIASTWTGWQ